MSRRGSAFIGEHEGMCALVSLSFDNASNVADQA
jgi:hypothetical protein